MHFKQKVIVFSSSWRFLLNLSSESIHGMTPMFIHKGKGLGFWFAWMNHCTVQLVLISLNEPLHCPLAFLLPYEMLRELQKCPKNRWKNQPNINLPLQWGIIPCFLCVSSYKKTKLGQSYHELHDLITLFRTPTSFQRRKQLHTYENHLK